MSHAVQYSDRRETDVDPVDAPISVSHLVHVLRAYKAVILIALLSVAVGYGIIAILLYLMSPAQRTTMQPFRLEFRGATEGMLPNGVRFAPTEIISTPVLLKVHQTDQLAPFISYGDFSRSIFVMESNRAYEKLVADYQARLSDPKLTPLDRDRIQKEFESKQQSINKNDYAVSYARTSSSGGLPETLARKVLLDILQTWAVFAINEQHALDYRVAVLSPQILDQSEVQNTDPIVAIQVLRSKIYRVIENIEEINRLPAADLIKTSDRMSLAEIRMRLEDIVRFRLEPLVGVARASGMILNPAVTIHFLDNQLAYEERRQQTAAARVNAAREALAMYSNEQRTVNDTMTTFNARPRGTSPAGEGETVMPQLTDTFLERLIGLSKQAVDSEYRQKLVDDYRSALAATIPLQEAVNYQKQVLAEIRSGAAIGPRLDKSAVHDEIKGSTAEVRRLIGKTNEIYQLVSRTLSPSTQLFSVVGPPTTRIERTRTLSRLALYGVVILLIALPLVVLSCFLHNRVREEEAAQVIPRSGAKEPA